MSATLTSRIAELTGPRQLIFREQSLATSALKDNELLAETVCSALSAGTEVAAWRGDPPLRPGPVYPRLVGYCNVAEIVACGRGVTRFRPGVRILTFQSHRSAFVCREDEVIVTLPVGTAPVPASVTYLFHLGYNALLRGGFTPGHHVGVIGLGTIGLAAVAQAGNFGGNVHAFSNQPDARNLALEIGALDAWPKDLTETPKAVAAKAGGAGLDLVITTSNRWEDWALALRLARKGGTLCVLGFPGRTEPEPPLNPLDSQFFYDRQLTIHACGQSPDLDVSAHDLRFTVKRNCEFLLHQIVAGKLPARRLIGSVQPWEKLPELYEQLAHRTGHALTGVLQWK